MLDMAGARWADDLGSDSYYDRGYFSLQKFDCYCELQSKCQLFSIFY